MNVLEVEATSAVVNSLWLRGGFPDSFLAPGDAASVRLRKDFIRSYLHRDVAMFNSRLPAETLERLWTMLAHNQGTVLNQSRLAGSLGASAQTIGRYIDLLSVAPPETQAGFYRTSAGAEMDLVLDLLGGERWAIEIKRGHAPTLGRGFHHACEDLQPHRTFVVFSGDAGYPMPGGVEVVALRALADQLVAQ